MLQAMKRFIREEDGVTALEYGLLAAVVAGALLTFSTPLRNFFTSLMTTLTSALGTASSSGSSS